jgi:preprotein translocase subunit SecD
MKTLFLAAAFVALAVPAIAAQPALLEARAIIDCKPGAKTYTLDTGGVMQLVCLSPDLVFDQSDILDSAVGHTAYGTDVVRITLGPSGTDRLGAATADLAARHGRMAIVYDGKLVSAPMVMDPIKGNRTEISFGNSDDLDAVVDALRSAKQR